MGERGGRGDGRRDCGCCGRADPTAAERGRLHSYGVLCAGCWNRRANRLAVQDEITDPTVPEFGPDDTTHYEPEPCPRCGMPVAHYRTDYDKWVHLAVEPAAPGAVPRRYLWRLVNLARHPGAPGDTVAERLGDSEPDPEDRVFPAHRAVCRSPDAVSERAQR